MRATSGQLPNGTVTLLLGDVEGSTGTWQRSSELARSVMSDLDELVGELVTKFDGARPLEQGEGDNFVAGFARASDGLACALEIQRLLVDGSLRVRMALHTGEIDVRDGKRYEGLTIIRAARIRDLGHGGQTLTSSSTRDLVQDSLPDGADLVDLGSHRLKGLDREEHVYQLTHPVLGGHFPPLRSAETVKSNLPVRLTSFVGRTRELEEVQRLVCENRLVTLTGAGGCGKTRLAVEATEQIADEFSDGIWFCDLGPLADPEVVAAAVRTTLGLREQANRSDIEVVCTRLRDAHALIVIDNCEHLIDASADVIDALLRGCREVHVLTTSREPTGVEGEIAWRVPSLDVPAKNEEVSPDDLAGFDAVALFVDRATRARPTFSLTSECSAAVREICTRLEGIPLAIELAAARVRVLSVADVAAGLNDRFRMLGRGARTVLARQQTLLASVGWSHDLLTDAQQVTLHRLSVFAGGFSLEGAEAVVSGADIKSSEVLELVCQLVDRSLLVADETADAHRYRMLETIRQFARDRLVDSGEAKEIAGRHLDHFADWAERLFGRLDRLEVDLADVVGSVLVEYDNIRAACEWALEDEQHETGLRLASALDRFWIGHESGREAERWLEALLAGAGDISPVTRARGLYALSSARENFNDFPGTIEAASEALPLARESGDPRLLCRVMVRLGEARGIIDREPGLQLLDEAVKIARATEDSVCLADALFNISFVKGFSGEGLVAAREAVDVAIPLGEAVAARPRFAVGACLLGSGDFREAFGQLDLARAGFILVGDEFIESVSEAAMGRCASLQGDPVEGRRLAERGFARVDELGRVDGRAVVGLWLAMYEACDGNLTKADQYLEHVWPFAGDVPGPMATGMRFYAHALGALVRLASRDLAGARSKLDAASAEVPADMFALWAAGSYFTCARVARGLGEVTEAESYAQEALNVCVDDRNLANAPDILEVVAALRADVGAYADAARLFGAAHAARQVMGSIRLPDPTWDADSEIAAIRDRLGEDEFAKEWSAGEGLSLDDAMAYALRGRGPRQRPPAGWDSITPTESKVIELVAEGLSNPQIAERLFISRRTVSTHLSHVFSKLGVTSRAELASLATRRAQ